MPRSYPDLLFLIADSLRYDSAIMARTPNLDRFGEIHRCYAQATGTWPSLMGMLVGLLPHAFEPIPLYNRFISRLVRMGPAWPGSRSAAMGETPEITIDDEWSIPHGYRAAGANTVATGPSFLSWMNHPFWAANFESYSALREASQQAQWFLQRIDERPCFGLINFGETHAPYAAGAAPEPLPDGYARHKLGEGPLSSEDFARLHRRQITACEYLDDVVGKLCQELRPGTTVVFTGDHGECFGEDGYFGHGFYHPKVMEVPMLIFQIPVLT